MFTSLETDTFNILFLFVHHTVKHVIHGQGLVQKHASVDKIPRPSFTMDTVRSAYDKLAALVPLLSLEQLLFLQIHQSDYSNYQASECS